MPDSVESAHILFYNVENLFDTVDNPLTNDNDYLPDSKRKWRLGRYHHKLNQLARVIQEVEQPFPAIVGLAEVENRKVLIDLIEASNLTPESIGIIHSDSPDERGMDVAMLYRKELFIPQHTESIEVQITSDPEDRTRNILYVKGILGGCTDVHFFVNHWPSRKSGTKVSMPKRIDAARTLSDRISQIQLAKPDSKILVMGDFNCTPSDSPVFNFLDTTGRGEGNLINLGWPIHRAGEGSTSYRKKWFLFDQMLVSGTLLQSSVWPKVDEGSFQVFKRDWMLFYNPVYHDYRPNKSYGGKRHHGGFSDHLPVTCKIEFR